MDMKDKAKTDFEKTDDQLVINADIAVSTGISGLVASGGQLWGALIGVAMAVGVDCLSHREHKKFKCKHPTPQ